jgi:tetraacyldisaccharide 4'-kinase
MSGLKLISNVYGAVQVVRGRAFERSFFSQEKIPGVKVISVGNIAAGGRGKSPLSLYIAGWFSKMGINTALLLRGYKGRMEFKGGLVSRGSGPLVSPEQSGDEAWQAAILCQGVTVRTGAGRAAQAALAAADGAKVIILDDGFQHRGIYRDLDIVSIAPEDILPDAGYLPGGHLREKKQALKRADIICGNINRWGTLPGRPELLFDYESGFLIDMDGKKHDPAATFSDPVHLLCAIENPDLFTLTVKNTGWKISSATSFADHHKFTERDIKDAVDEAKKNGAALILTTVKDMARILSVAPQFPVFALEINLKIIEGANLLNSHLKDITWQLF